MKISFGTLFKVSKEATLEKDRTDVVVNVGEEDYFYAARTFQKEGKVAFSLQTGVATARRQHIGSITGQLSPQEMLVAAILGSLEKMGRELDEGEKANLERFATRGEREI